MRQVHLQDVDLNLLLALHALLAERHVTRAAKRCHLSQSAMSRALERLRQMFGDRLLVRSGRAYERTGRGERVLRELESLMPRLEAFDRVIATNLRGSFIVLAQAAQHVAQGGRIIMFSSSVVAKSFPGYGPYIASKAGVEGLVHVLANELRGREIRVNAVAPGPVATELFLKGKSEAQVEQFRKLPPLERIGQPEDIADVVSFLAGPTGGWVNSQVIRANGGFA